jgi:transketolase
MKRLRLTGNGLAEKARRVRRHIVRMIAAAGSGHPGGSLSAADILTALYFGGVMRVDPSDPDWPGRDRLVLSKGHAAPALYAVLAERGFFPVEDLAGLRDIDSHLQGHPDMKGTPGVDASTGSLGQGLSFAVGLALASKLDRAPWRVYVLLGDGEVQEGQIWEAAMAAAHYRLDNLTAYLDHNGLQIDGRVEDVMSIRPVAAKWRAFGWHVIEVDGHDMEQLLRAAAEAAEVKDRPTMVVARTVKGRGVSFMENRAEWHGKAPTPQQLAEAMRELGAAGPLGSADGGGVGAGERGEEDGQ